MRKKSASRRHFSAPMQEHPDSAETTVQSPPPSSPSCGGRNAVKKEMFKKVHRSISMMGSHSMAPTPDESEETAVAAIPRSKSTMTNSLQIPGVFERSVSVCEESVNSARKMLEDLFGRRAPPPSPQCSVEGGAGLKKSSLSGRLDDAVSMLDQGPDSIEKIWLEKPL